MYNKKCNSTFLIVVALLCFFTLVVPFMNVGFYGTTPLILKILYYIFITIFIICIVLIIVIGIYNLFKNNFFLTPIQNVLSYIALIALLLNLLLFSPCRNCNLTVGYSILNKTSKVNVGSLMLKYGGGGHEKVGTCQFTSENMTSDLPKMLEELKSLAN